MKTKQKSDARQIALNILNTLDQGHNTLDHIMEEIPDDLVSKLDRALLNALVYGVLRWRGRLDYIINHFSKTPLTRIDSKILNILRLGIFQILLLDKIPVFAAVNTSVEMAKLFAPPWVVKFVNGILRNAAKGCQSVTFPNIDTNPVTAVAAIKSFPEWLIKRWLSRFGLEETMNLCDAVNAIPPISVRTNTLKTDRHELIKALEGDVEHCADSPYAPEGISFSNPKTSIPNLNAFKSGWFQVQDQAAQLVAYLLNPQPGEKILDACAGLGGKTGHIAQLMRNQGSIMALDIDAGKLLRLKSEMKRLGVSIVTSETHDLNQSLNRGKIHKFDRILLDAPCSGLGVLRRNPDIKWAASEKKLLHYQERQVQFLGNLASRIKPSGYIVYAVCSTEPEENEVVIEAFLNKHLGFCVEKNHPGLPPKAASLVSQNGYLKTFPHQHHMDGFFAVCMKYKT